MNRMTCIALLMPLLAGCSALKYREPTEGPRARVRFTADTDDNSLLLAYDAAGCTTHEQEWMRLRVGVHVLSSPKRMGMPLWEHHDNAAKEVHVDASKPLHAMFVGGSHVTRPGTATHHASISVYSCGVAFTYAFEADKDYQVSFNWHPQRCTVTVSELVRQDDGYARVTREVFDNQLAEQNQGCMARFHKWR